MSADAVAQVPKSGDFSTIGDGLDPSNLADALTVAVMVVIALTLLPASLAVVGSRIDALRIRSVAVRNDGEGPWARVARAVVRSAPTESYTPGLGERGGRRGR